MISDLLGAHVSTAGGIPEAPPRAKAIAATAMQIFTKQANRWAERACEGDECAKYTAALGAPPYKGDGYNVYNFGSTDYYGNAMVMRINNQPASISQAMPDGTSNCVIIGERYQSCGDPINDFASFPGWGETTAFPDGDPLDTPIYGTRYCKNLGAGAGLWVDPNSTTPTKGPGSWSNNGGPNFSSGGLPFQVQPSKTSCDISLLQTAHNGGMVVGLGDGSTRFVNGIISTATWTNINDPRDGNVVAADWQ
jgi:hypothetical protein